MLLSKVGADFRLAGSDANGNGSMWITMPEHFKRNNFTTLGGGKTFHPGTQWPNESQLVPMNPN
eukprot:SAG31_NODE_1367_length_8615_cov_12.875763_9_plen_64_part_00